MGTKNLKGTVSIENIDSSIRIRWRYQKKISLSFFHYNKFNISEEKRIADAIEIGWVTGNFDSLKPDIWKRETISYTMPAKEIISLLVNETLPTGKPFQLTPEIGERIKSFLQKKSLPADEFYDEVVKMVQRSVYGYYKAIEDENFSQEEYQRLKQFWHNCRKSRKDEFLFLRNGDYIDFSAKL